MSTYVDSKLNFPLGCCDEDGAPTLPGPGICRGHLDIFDQEGPQAVWEAGQDAHFQLSDYTYSSDAPGSTHYGGSCQVGFSVDRGQTWKAAASYMGNCPHRDGNGSPEVQTFDFKVPLGMPEGEAIFVWVWLNREHESFVNCAKVRIASSLGNQTRSAKPEEAFQSATQPMQPPRATAEPKQSDEGPRNHIRQSNRNRVDACVWESAPSMETSYYYTNAVCMPNAKLENPKSDSFEVGWDVSCGVVEGDGVYPIQVMDCRMYD